MTMTKPELAKLLKTSSKEISDIETGKKEPSGHYVVLIAQILGLDMADVEITLAVSNSPYQLGRIAQSKYGSQNA
jgi:DNA-binding XRE family transcriptional regulator